MHLDLLRFLSPFHADLRVLHASTSWEDWIDIRGSSICPHLASRWGSCRAIRRCGNHILFLHGSLNPKGSLKSLCLQLKGSLHHPISLVHPRTYHEKGRAQVGSLPRDLVECSVRMPCVREWDLQLLPILAPLWQSIQISSCYLIHLALLRDGQMA